MMKNNLVFLTSNPMNKEGNSIHEKNGLLQKLKSSIPQDSNALFICSNSDFYERTDKYGNILRNCFENSGITFSKFSILDRRNESIAGELVSNADFIVLMGGHVPTQNTFFHHIHLKELLQDSKAILLGFSAGSMNMAEVVYAQPELNGEAISEEYIRFLPGLGITKTMIIPHYQLIKDDVLDGMRMIEDITYPDSIGKEFIALVDGSYIEIIDHVEKLYGEAYLIKDGKLIELNKENEVVGLVGKIGKEDN